MAFGENGEAGPLDWLLNPAPAPAPAPIAPKVINGGAVTNDGAGWTKAGTLLDNASGVDSTGSLAVSAIDSPTLDALGFSSWLAADPSRAIGPGYAVDSGQPLYSATDAFLQDAHLTLYSKPIGAPGVAMQATQAVDAFGAPVGPEAHVSTDTGDGLVFASWLGMAGGFGLATALGGAAVGGAAVDAAPTLTDGAFLGENVASGVGAWDAAATSAGLTLTAPAAALPSLVDAAPSIASSSSSALPSLSSIGQAAGTVSSLGSLAKSIGILPTPRSSALPSSSTPSSSSSSTRGLLLLAGALAVGALLLRKKGAL